MAEPTCINAASINYYDVPCTTTYEAFASKPPGDIGTLTCQVTYMGPSYDDDPSCHRLLSGGPDHVACPTGWTSAGQSAYTGTPGLTWLLDFCCPEYVDTITREFLDS